MPATGSFDKGAAVEEWSDTWFFRPIGLRIARACEPTRITPDQVTVVAMVIGLLAGHLLYYTSVTLNVVGVALFVVSDIFDSADGQLARMRGTSTRLGKMLDGLGDASRFMNLYFHLMARMIVTGAAWWYAVPLGLAAGVAHARQMGAIDYIRQLYLHLGQGGAGEFDLPDDLLAIPRRNRFQDVMLGMYRQYLKSHSRSVPRSMELIRRIRVTGAPTGIGELWSTTQRTVVRQCAWIGQNIRFLLLAVTVVPGYPAAFFWITLVPMTAVMVALLVVHERHAAAILGEDTLRLAEAA